VVIIASVRVTPSGVWAEAVRAGRALKHPELDQEPDRDADQYEEANQAKRVRIPVQGNVDTTDWSFSVSGFPSTGPKLRSPTAIMDGM
jgi:hypothetical protein